MPDRVQDLTNHRKVAQASKNYTDQKAEEILWQLAENDVSTSDDNTTASTKTVPANATRCKIKRIYGYTQKFNPSVASDSTSAMVKTMPATVYDFDVSKVYGKSEKASNLSIGTLNANINAGGVLEASSAYKMLIIQATSGKTYYLQNFTYNQVVIAYYSTMPTINSVSIDGRRTVIENTNSFTATSSNYIAVRFDINDTNASVVEYEDIHNLELSGLKVEGSNIADTSLFELGAINTTNGADSVNNERMRSNYIEVQPSTQYTLKWDNNDVNYFFYDENKTYIQKSVGGTFTTTATTKYVRFYGGLITTSTQILFNKGTNTTYIPYVSQTLPIDLSTILYNGSPLFEGNSLKAVGTAKDYITPYVAHKQMGYVDLGSLNYVYDSANLFFRCNNLTTKTYDGNTVGRFLTTLYTAITQSQGNDKTRDMVIFGLSWANTFAIRNLAYTDATQFKTAMSGVYLVYELATPIEVSIDWSTTLRHITGYSNGTITLLNTNNMDTDNTITYNSIIQENCCAKIVQSRGGNVVKTINLPTTASDGYSAGSVNNYRDLTTNKRETNVYKENHLEQKDWSWTDAGANSRFWFPIYDAEKPSSNAVAGNILINNYENVDWDTFIASSTNLVSLRGTDGVLGIRDNKYSSTNEFKTSLTNEPLFYELADASKTETSIDSVENVIEVEPSDVLSFYDENDNLVTVPSDLTYRIEVAR